MQYIHPESISALTSGLEEWSLNNSYGLPQGVISANYNSLAMGGLQRFGMLLQILCTGFVLLLCLVCMANIHNSLSTGMELRAREYGILRSVGITPVDFRKMIWLESLFYGIKSDVLEFTFWNGRVGPGILCYPTSIPTSLLSASGQHCPGSCFSNGGMLDFWTSDPQESGGADYYRAIQKKLF